MEAPEPFLQSAMVGVHVVDVIFRLLWLRIARRGQGVDIELGAPRERRNGRSSITASPSTVPFLRLRRGGLSASAAARRLRVVGAVARACRVCSSVSPRLSALPPRLREVSGDLSAVPCFQCVSSASLCPETSACLVESGEAVTPPAPSCDLSRTLRLLLDVLLADLALSSSIHFLVAILTIFPSTCVLLPSSFHLYLSFLSLFPISYL